jgi:FMN phosphatase YigB (HAD superfamily)
MPQSLSEYIETIHQRPDLIWPKPPAPVPLKATPFLKPLPGIRAVTWSVYGTLLTIDQGELLHLHPQELRMQIALEKTIKEFNMWYSMSRKPGQPWEYMLQQYTKIVEDFRLHSTKRKGDVPELNSQRIWLKILERLVKNEYSYDENSYGDLNDLAAKVAYFFHASLQGVQAADHACETLSQLTSVGIRQGLLADGQVFTLPQLLRELRTQHPVQAVKEVLAPEILLLSTQIGLRKPSETLYKQAASNFKGIGLEPGQVLHVSHRLRDDLAVAKRNGFRTALLVADGNCTRVTAEEVRNPDLKPDRLISDVRQIGEILQV